MILVIPYQLRRTVIIFWFVLFLFGFLWFLFFVVVFYSWIYTLWHTEVYLLHLDGWRKRSQRHSKSPSAKFCPLIDSRFLGVSCPTKAAQLWNTHPICSRPWRYLFPARRRGKSRRTLNRSAWGIMRSHKASLPQADGNCYLSGLSFHMTGFTKYIELKWPDCNYAKIRAGLKAQENWHLLRCVRVDSA